MLFSVSVCWGGGWFTHFWGEGSEFGISTLFFPWYNDLNEFSFADTDRNNSEAALQIRSPSPVSSSAWAETCLVGCLN